MKHTITILLFAIIALLVFTASTLSKSNYEADFSKRIDQHEKVRHDLDSMQFAAKMEVWTRK